MAVKVQRDKDNPNYWWVRIHHRKKRKSLGFGNRKAAEQAAAKIAAALKLDQVGILDSQSRPTTTFGELTVEWLQWYPGLHAVRESTMENHRSFAQTHLVPFFGQHPVTDITTNMIEDFIGVKRAPGGSIRREGKALADSSLKVGLNTLRLILSLAVRRRLLASNPIDLADWRATPRVEHVDPFTAAELREIVRAAEELEADFATLLMVWAQAGMREGEVLGLRRSDIDLGKGTALVQRTWSRGRLGPTKTGVIRIVSFMHPVTEDVTAWQPAATAESRVVLVRLKALKISGMDPESFLFGSGATPIGSMALYRLWRRTLLRAGVRYRSPEQLRHTFASTMLSRNAPLLYVQQQGGWRSATVLLRVYARWMPPPWQPDAIQAQPSPGGRSEFAP